MMRRMPMRQTNTTTVRLSGALGAFLLAWVGTATAAEEWWKPYSPPCVERENVFEFTEKPKVKNLGNDRYEITFAVKGNCDVAVGIVDPSTSSRLREDATAGTAGQGEKGVVVRHLGSGVLGANAPAPFQKNSLKQTIYWNGKDDLDVYHKEPGRCRVRVMLGLKPEFDKLLADYGPDNLPGFVWGIAIAEDGARVFTKPYQTHGHMAVRHFDHDGNYIQSLVPPPANMPEEKLNGLSYVEYEPGKRAIHGEDLGQMAVDGFVLPGINSKHIGNCQVALIGRRIYFSNRGLAYGGGASLLHYLNTDGSTDVQGMKGVSLVDKAGHLFPRFAASPDGKRLYMCGIGGDGSTGADSFIAVKDVEVSKPARIFSAKRDDRGRPVMGSDNDGLNNPQGIDCDAQGRVYISDNFNNRVQVFSADGKWLKTIPLDRPRLIRIHRKTGTIYVEHGARIQGKSVGRLSRLKSFDDPSEVWHMDFVDPEPTPSVLAVDEWTAKPRLWMAGGNVFIMPGGIGGSGPSVRIWEDEGTGLKKIADFDEATKKRAGSTGYLGRWGGGDTGGSGGGGRLVCDPVRETVYYNMQHVFDLKTGALLGELRVPGTTDDIAFDKKGFLHAHFNPGFFTQGAGRFDPSRPRNYGESRTGSNYEEVPYDYGEERPFGTGKRFLGIIALRDQPGAKFFQDGIGVNMRGEVAENCNIYYVPKTDDGGYADLIHEWRDVKGSDANYGSGGGGKYDAFNAMMRRVKDQEKQGEQVYSIRRAPGIPLSGATIWTFDANGELKGECAVIAGGLINGVHMAEDGKLWFVASALKMVNGKRFLNLHGGTFGAPDDKSNSQPFMGSLIKVRPDNVRFLSKNATIPLEELPSRPGDLCALHHWAEEAGAPVWVEGAEWIYAGASPIVPGGCSCPTQRSHLDWYQRCYLPETYRHSVGILDTAGNLIMHLGRYGNYDSGFGAKSKIPVGGDNIAFFVPRMVSGTDNYLAVSDWGERLVVLKLNYHAEETVGISNQ